jgi:subtilase family serine protease
MRLKRPQFLRPALDILDDRCLLSATVLPSGGFTPSQILTAYGLNSLTVTTPAGTAQANGTGETIAIVDAYHDPYLASDLATFDKQFNIAAPPSLTQDNLSNSATNTNDGWAQEETLDVEWAHAVAPGASIVVVEANSASLTDLMSAVNAARAIPSVSVVSMSWGESEFAGETAYDSLFTTPAGHQGITFVASAGDTPGTEWPAASPNVVAVGGTTLQLSSTGAIASETAWSSTGGGLSQFESEPAFQDKVQSTGSRSTPDVAFDANPSTGVYVFTTTPSTGQGSWQIVGGTSVGAPVLAGLIAIADQVANDAGTPTLTSTQTLTALYSAPSSDFHIVTPTVTTGAGFGFGGRFSGAQSTTPLTTTGLGSPVGSLLIESLSGTKLPVTEGTPTTTGTGTGTTTGTGTGTTTTPPTNGGGTTTTPPTNGGGTTTPPPTAPPTSGGGTPMPPGGGFGHGRFGGGRDGWWWSIFGGGSPTGGTTGTGTSTKGGSTSTGSGWFGGQLGTVTARGGTSVTPIRTVAASPTPTGPLGFRTLAPVGGTFFGTIGYLPAVVATNPTHPAAFQNAPVLVEIVDKALHAFY